MKSHKLNKKDSEECPNKPDELSREQILIEIDIMMPHWEREESFWCNGKAGKTKVDAIKWLLSELNKAEKNNEKCAIEGCDKEDLVHDHVPPHSDFCQFHTENLPFNL